MSKIIFIFSIFILNIFANTTVLQKQNVLYVQNLITKEEAIAEAFERYLLNEFKLPKIEDLQVDEYLGSNFSLENIMGSSLDFVSNANIDENSRLKYAITKSTFLNDTNSYIEQLYSRELYRDRTYAVVIKGKDDEGNDTLDKYVSMELKSAEAKNIFDILSAGDEILKDCKNPEKDKFCNDDKYLRYYITTSNYIEFTKEKYLNGNLYINFIFKSDMFVDGGKFEKLKLNSFIYDRDSIIYLKFSPKEILEINSKGN